MKTIVVCAAVVSSLLPRLALAEPALEPEAGSFGPPEPDRTTEPAPAAAAPAFSWQVESGAASTYVFRGRPQYATRRDASAQSLATMTWNQAGPGALSVGAWNAMALGHAHAAAGAASEVDLSAMYALTLREKWSVGVGYTAYVYPNATRKQYVDGAHELAATLTYNGVVSPFVGVYPEPVRMKGAYATAGLSKKITIAEVYSITPLVAVAAAGYQGTAAHFHELSGSLVATRTFTNGLYVSARGNWTLMGGPAGQLPGADGSLQARSLPWGMLAMGVQL